MQPIAFVIETVYVVVVVGETVGLKEVGLLTPVEGVQIIVKVVSVIAWIIVDSPEKSESLSAVAEIGKDAGLNTETVVDNVCVQVSPWAFTAVTITVYVVVFVGVAVGLAIVALFKLDAGDHIYEIPPVASSEALPPTQIVVLGFIVAADVLLKETKAVSAQPFIVVEIKLTL